MPKLILLLFLGLLAYLVLKGFQRPPSSRPKTGRKARAPERMVACARCGINVPESEAIAGNGGPFCSEEHRRLGPA